MLAIGTLKRNVAHAIYVLLEAQIIWWLSPTPTTQMMKGPAHLNPVWGGLLCCPQSWWGGSGHPPQKQQQNYIQPVRGRWCGLPSPGAGPYPTVTSSLGWIVQGVSTLQSGSPATLQPPLHPAHWALQSDAASPARAIGRAWLPYTFKKTVFAFPRKNAPPSSPCFDSTPSSWLNCTQ